MNPTNFAKLINDSFEFMVTTKSSTLDLSCDLFLSETEVAALLLFLGIFGVVGFLQNLVVIFSIILTDGFLDAPANVFVLNLAFSDMLICCVFTPLFMYNCSHWIFSELVKVSKFIVVATTGSIFLMTINRFISIVKPLRYTRLMTYKRALYLVSIIWLVASLIPVLALIGLTYEIKPIVHLTRYFLSFYILSSSAMYGYMYNLARKHRGKLRELKYAVTGQIHTTLNEFKALRSLFMVAGCFAACWSPMTIGFFFTNRFTDPIQFYRTFSFTAPLAVVNAILDPTIYYYRSKEFRTLLRMIYKRFQQ